MDNIRNKWIIAVSIVYIILIILSSYLTGGQTGDNEIFGTIEATVIFARPLTFIFIPIISIILGYSTIVGEAETGSLSVVLSYPVKRVEVILGKFLGLGSILVITPFIGFGISGIIIMLSVGAEEAALLILFIFLTILLGLMYLSSTILISAICKTRSRAIGGGLILFFWIFIYNIILGIVQLSVTADLNSLLTFPDWVWASRIISPSDIFILSVDKIFEINPFIPNWMNMEFLLIAHIIWIVIPLILAIIFFKRRDI
jgi:Cu-processing system permease protein